MHMKPPTLFDNALLAIPGLWPTGKIAQSFNACCINKVRICLAFILILLCASCAPEGRRGCEDRFFCYGGNESKLPGNVDEVYGRFLHETMKERPLRDISGMKRALRCIALPAFGDSVSISVVETSRGSPEICSKRFTPGKPDKDGFVSDPTLVGDCQTISAAEVQSLVDGMESFEPNDSFDEVNPYSRDGITWVFESFYRGKYGVVRREGDAIEPQLLSLCEKMVQSSPLAGDVSIGHPGDPRNVVLIANDRRQKR